MSVGVKKGGRGEFKELFLGDVEGYRRVLVVLVGRSLCFWGFRRT